MSQVSLSEASASSVGCSSSTGGDSETTVAGSRSADGEIDVKADSRRNFYDYIKLTILDKLYTNLTILYKLYTILTILHKLYTILTILLKNISFICTIFIKGKQN